MADTISASSSLSDLQKSYNTATTTPKFKTTDTSSSMISDNYNTFLTMLTTQMKNQDPLQPMDSSQFTNQLVQFSQVEQMLKQTDSLQALVDNSNTQTTSNAVGYLGMQVLADGNQFALDANSNNESGLATEIITYNLPSNVDSATLTIYDSSGAAVRTAQIEPTPGEVNLTWDGQMDDGSFASVGNYSFKISAKDADGKQITSGISYKTRGIVNNVTDIDGVPSLTVDDRKLAIKDVLAIGLPGYI